MHWVVPPVFATAGIACRDGLILAAFFAVTGILRFAPPGCRG